MNRHNVRLVVAFMGVAVIGGMAGFAISGRPTPVDTFVVKAADVPRSTATPVTGAVVASTSTTVDARPKVSISIIGDSYTGGSLMGGGGSANWADIVLRGLDRTNYFTPYEVHGEGGAGYVQPGVDNLTFAGLAESIPNDAAIVVIFGSRNDGGGYSPDSISNAATDLYAQINKRAPDGKLLVIGPPWVDENVPKTILTIRDRLKIAATKAGATFVDPIADKWFFGADSALIGSDGVHPTDAGHKYMADRILPFIKALFPPLG